MVILTDKPKQPGVYVQNGTENMADPLTATVQSDTVAQVEYSEIGGLFVIQNLDAARVQRLVALVPNLDVDEVAFAHAIWELAFPPGLAVLLLGLCPNPNVEPGARRRLVA